MTHLRPLPDIPQEPPTPTGNVHFRTRVWWGSGPTPQHALLAEGIAESLDAAARYAETTFAALPTPTAEGWVWVEATPVVRTIADQWRPVEDPLRAIFNHNHNLTPWTKRQPTPPLWGNP